MQNRDDVDGSQRPRTADAPNLNQATEGHLGRGGDPVEGRDPDAQDQAGDTGGSDPSDHLGPAGDPVEGAEGVSNNDASTTSVGGVAQNTPAKE